ncbi:MAG: rod shape-determining protein RodA [Chloroflexi bacterium]|nr:rod shape-determining protein RodA [Chloroflexota bacterium]
MVSQSRHQYDLWILLTPLALVLIGLVLLYSASYPQELGGPVMESPPGRQALYALVGFALLLLVARLDYRLLGNAAPGLYALVIVLLGLVLVLGAAAYGSRRWLDLGLFPLQPSELAKPVVALALAKYFAESKGEVGRLRTFVGSLAIVGLPMSLVYFQPDLGTAIVFAVMWLGIAIMGGARLWHLALTAGALVVTAPPAYFFVLKGYMQERIHLFLDPTGDPLGAGYNILQSEISVGSGGLLGKGLLNGTQSQLHFLRVQQTDFIFSVLGEELGFLGALLVFALFALLLLRGVRIATEARDDLGRLLATGVVIALLAQVFINVGVNIRLLPVTGIPLPLISFGGNSLLSVLLSLGVLQSVYAHRQRVDW